MSDEQKARITSYVKQLCKLANDEANADILDFVIEDVASRVLLYLNRTELPTIIERIVARIVTGIFIQTAANFESTTADSEISSMSDNGQSISYSGEVKKYLSNTEDNEIFTGFAKILAPFRRVNVVSEES